MRFRPDRSRLRSRLRRGFVPVCLLAASLLAGAGTAEAQLVDTRRATLENYPETRIADLAPRYRKWVEEEVGYLITNEERNVFVRLGSDQQRDAFIDEFWEQRDPTPGTPRNENRDEWYERLEYVNKFYGRGTSLEGWQTDRGRIYMTLGKPRMINRYPSDMLTYPAEVWMYSADPDLGLPPFFYMMFYQRFGAGDYRVYSPLSDGPERLLNGAGSQEVDNRRVDPRYNERYSGYSPEGFYGDSHLIHSILREIDYDLASAAFNLFPSEAGLEYNVSPLRSELLIGQVEQVKDIIMPDPTWAYNILTGVTDAEVRFETLTFDVVAHGLIDPDGEPFLHFALQSIGEQLNVADYEDEYYFSFDANGSVTTADNKVLQTFDMDMTGELDEEQARRFTRNPFLFIDMMPTLPGRQTLSLIIENEAALTFGQREIELDVPSKFPETVDLAGPVLLAVARQLEQYDPFGSRYAFQYQNLAMVPSVDGKVFAGTSMNVFQQILLPAGYEAPLETTIELRGPTGAVVASDAMTYEASEADANGVISHIWALGTMGISTGDYQLRVTVGDDIESVREVSIVSMPEEQPQPFINAQPAPPATDVWIALERARQYRAVGDLDNAATWLRSALEKDPDNDDLRAEHADLLESAGLWAELIELLTPVMVENPTDADLLLRMARAYANAGEHYDAIRYYERSRMVLNDDSTDILNALANEYIADGQQDKARQLLQRSLELDAAQPEVQQLLDRIAVPVSETQS
jgi:GWxTD domain-containing protein